jgi:hypothetical protein
MKAILAAALALAAIPLAAPVAHAEDHCYQKLFYQICSGDDGQWRVNPVPALPMPPMPPPAPGPTPIASD